MSDLYRCKRRGDKRWRYGEGRTRPVAVLGLRNNEYPKGSQERREKAEAWEFVCERLDLGQWIVVTEEFL